MKKTRTLIKVPNRTFINKDTLFRKVTEAFKSLSDSDKKVHGILLNASRHLTNKEIATAVSLSERHIIRIINKLTARGLVPDLELQRRRTMAAKLTLLKRTPEQVKAEKEAAKKAAQEQAEYEKTCAEFNKQYEQKVYDADFLLVPDTVDSIIHYWNNKPGLSRLQIPLKSDYNGYINPSKVLRRCVLLIKRLLAGTAFAKTEFLRKNRKFTVQEIKQAIERFSTAATSDRHFPLRKDSLRRMNLELFIYSNYHKEEKYRSQFLYYIENEPQPRVEIAGEAPADKCPPLSFALLKRCETVFNFDPDDWRTRNNIVVAANKLYAFWIENQRDQLWIAEMTVNSIIAEFIDALFTWAQWKEDRRVMPQTLTQDWAIKGVFKTHCLSMGLLMGLEKEEESVDESMLLSEFAEPETEDKEPDLELEPTTADLTNLATKLFPPEEPSDELSWEQKIIIKKERAEKERNKYENAPYD